MMSRHEHQISQPQWFVLIGGLACVGLIGWLDYILNWEWSFFILYAAPIAFVTWATQRNFGFMFAILCTVVWCLAQFNNHPYLSGTGFALAAVGRLFYFAILVIAVTAIKEQQDLRKARSEHINNAQALERGIIWAREREERRICGEIHDNLGSQLAAITYAATFLMNNLRALHQPEADMAAELRDMANAAAASVQDLSRSIYPADSGEGNLGLALNELAIWTSTRTGMQVSFHESGVDLDENPVRDMHLFRIVQEALNNAGKHGNANKVSIILNKSADSVHLAIADDGIGLTTAGNSVRGVGLRSMRYRARALGGDLEIDSGPNEGTLVSCEIPLPIPLSLMPDS